MTSLLTRSASALFLTATVAALTGCAPEFAPSEYGKTELLWKEKVKQSYGDWNPPPPPPPLRGASAAADGGAVDLQGVADVPVGPVVVESPALAPGETIEVDIKETAAPITTEEDVKAKEAELAASLKEEPVIEVPAGGDLAETKAAAMAPEGDAKDVDQFEEYVVQKGDSLWAISMRFYKKGGKAGVIYELNKDVIKDKNRLKPGTKLKIPTP